MLVDLTGHLLPAFRLSTGQEYPGALRHPVGRVSVAQQAV
jgi:hypothetical protein